MFCFLLEYKKARQEIKKKSSDTLKLQKKAKKGNRKVCSGPRTLGGTESVLVCEPEAVRFIGLLRWGGLEKGQEPAPPTWLQVFFFLLLFYEYCCFSPHAHLCTTCES